MKIFYNQSQLSRTLILGIAFLLIGLLSLFTTASIYLAGLGGIGILHIGTYFFYKNRAFIVFSGNSITINSLFKKRIALKDIRSVKYFAGDYPLA